LISGWKASSRRLAAWQASGSSAGSFSNCGLSRCIVLANLFGGICICIDRVGNFLSVGGLIDLFGRVPNCRDQHIDRPVQLSTGIRGWPLGEAERDPRNIKIRRTGSNLNIQSFCTCPKQELSRLAVTLAGAEGIKTYNRLVIEAGSRSWTDLQGLEDAEYRRNRYGIWVAASAHALCTWTQAHGWSRTDTVGCSNIASVAGKEAMLEWWLFPRRKPPWSEWQKFQGKEVAGTGVTVNALAPAVIQTPDGTRATGRASEIHDRQDPDGSLR
jgi:hypothetical protein